MGPIRLLTIALLLLTVGSPAAASPAKRSSDPKPDRFDLISMRRPMVFFVAKGAPDSCGPGCNEWIAAEGVFDKEAAKRFQDFLKALSRRDLPVFFSSDGGEIGQTTYIGGFLRENRMATGVGRTLPDGCAGTSVDDACWRVMQSKREHRARLVTKDVRCASACVYAFLGGAQRQIARDAKLGIHSARLGSKFATQGRRILTVDQTHNGVKSRLIEFGVEPVLVDAAAKVSPDRMHYLNRDEIARFGVETRGPFETSWLFDNAPQGVLNARRFFVRKTATEVPGAGEYRTLKIAIGCPSVWDLSFGYRRETGANEHSGSATVRLGDTPLPLVENRNSLAINLDVRQTPVSFDLLRKAATSPTIEITASFLVDGAERQRTTKLSTTGLSEALDVLAKHCVAGTLTGAPPAQATAR